MVEFVVCDMGQSWLSLWCETGTVMVAFVVYETGTSMVRFVVCDVGQSWFSLWCVRKGQ